MNISYSWLKDYINLELSPAQVAETLTQLGLETGSVDEVETIKGGLKGIIVGEVITCQKHPNSDHLSVTTVNIGGEEDLAIVCGAPNVARVKKLLSPLWEPSFIKERNNLPFRNRKSEVKFRWG